jgi:hypothetical protein
MEAAMALHGALTLLVIGLSLLLLLLLGCSAVETTGAGAQELGALDRPTASLQLEDLAIAYQPGGTLGFRLIEAPVEEQLYRPADGTERALLWSATFVSRWPLNEAQLDRWSAQAIGLVADGLGPDVRLAGWERLDATDLGERRVAYRYQLRTTRGDGAGEATIVVFSRGEAVGLTGAAALGTHTPVDAASVARVLNPDRPSS